MKSAILTTILGQQKTKPAAAIVLQNVPIVYIYRGNLQDKRMIVNFNEMIAGSLDNLTTDFHGLTRIY